MILKTPDDLVTPSQKKFTGLTNNIDKISLERYYLDHLMV